MIDLSIAPKQYRLAGETATKQVAVGLCVLGILGSVTAAWLFLAEPRVRIPIAKEAAEQPGREKAAPASSSSVSMEQAPAAPATRSATMEPATAARVEQSPPVKTIFEAAPTPAAATDSSIASSSVTATDSARAGVADAARPTGSDTVTTPAPPVENGLQGKEGDEVVEGDATRTKSFAAGSPLCPPLFTVLFAHNSTRPIVPPDFEARLASLQEWMNTHPDAKLLFEGYADSLGSSEFNLRLSARRAMAVARLAVKAGIAGERLAARAYGKSEPLAGEAADSAGNRRVTMRVEQAQQCPDQLD